ncbi:hypothetical protein GCM10010377_24750 [Streptomyces viridiviolaceus]|nr:hypothetical protein GCM10010377_24750 [Streptomyces viridiviolaceus]
MSCSRISRAARVTVVMGSTDTAAGDITSRIRWVMAPPDAAWDRVP